MSDRPPRSLRDAIPAPADYLDDAFSAIARGDVAELGSATQCARQAGWTWAKLADPLPGLTGHQLQHLTNGAVAWRGGWYRTPAEEVARYTAIRPPRYGRSVGPCAVEWELRRLYAAAKRTNGSAKLTDPCRAASYRLARLYMTYKLAGWTWSDIADLVGTTKQGVRIRATRHGYYSKVPNSMSRYRGTTVNDYALPTLEA